MATNTKFYDTDKIYTNFGNLGGSNTDEVHFEAEFTDNEGNINITNVRLGCEEPNGDEEKGKHKIISGTFKNNGKGNFEIVEESVRYSSYSKCKEIATNEIEDSAAAGVTPETHTAGKIGRTIGSHLSFGGNGGGSRTKRKNSSKGKKKTKRNNKKRTSMKKYLKKK